MQVLLDYQQRAVRLTNERLAHILEHPEMRGRQGQEGSDRMAERRVRVWYDTEGDYLEVTFDQKPGYFRETANDQVMEKVDSEGNILGFSVLRVSSLKTGPLEVALRS